MVTPAETESPPFPHFQPPLQAVTISDLITHKEKLRPRTPVISLEHNATISHALKVLARHRILSAPLVMSPSLEDLDGGGPLEEGGTAPTLLGWVDINDILRALLAHVKKHQNGIIPSNMLLLMNSLESAGRSFSDRALVTLAGGDDRSLVYETEAAAPLLQTVNDNLLNNSGLAGRVVHRLAVFDASGDVQHVVSQLDIIRLLASAPSSLLGDAVANSTLEQLKLLPSGPKHVVCVDPHVPTLIALDQMVTAGVSGAAVVSTHGELVANLSSSDLRGIQPEHLGVLALPVAEFLALLHGTSYLGYSQRSSKEASHPFFAASHHQQHAPLGVADVGPGSPAGLRNASPTLGLAASDIGRGGLEDSVRLITCRASSTLKEVLDLMVDNHVHRVYVVDPQAKPQVVAVVTPTDILRWLVVGMDVSMTTAAP